MEEERLVYAAYVAYCLRGFLPETDDEMDILFNNLKTMIDVAEIAFKHVFKYEGDKISTEAMYNDGFEDAWAYYKRRLGDEEDM